MSNKWEFFFRRKSKNEVAAKSLLQEKAKVKLLNDFCTGAVTPDVIANVQKWQQILFLIKICNLAEFGEIKSMLQN